MDFKTLPPDAQKRYLKLEKFMFSGRKVTLKKASTTLKIQFYEAFMFYSHMLKNHKTSIEQGVYCTQEPVALCPTCKKQKNEVTDTSVCRDVFHYIK